MKKALNGPQAKDLTQTSKPFPKHLSFLPTLRAGLNAFSCALDFSFSSFIHNQKPVQRTKVSTSKGLMRHRICKPDAPQGDKQCYPINDLKKTWHLDCLTLAIQRPLIIIKPFAYKLHLHCRSFVAQY